MKHKPIRSIIIQHTTDETTAAIEQVNEVAKHLRMRPTAAARLIISMGHKALMKRKAK